MKVTVIMEKILNLLKRLKLNFQQYIQNATSSGHKSTILMPLTWAMILLLSGTVTCHCSGVPLFITYTLFGLFILFVILFAICYVYCFFKNPDLIRSEKYAVTKLLVESGAFGDSNSGLQETPTTTLDIPQIVSPINVE